MKKFIFLSTLFFIANLVLAINPPKNLKVDYNVNPMGVDVPNPGFTWEVGDLPAGRCKPPIK